jgi:hypothetical protein
MTELTPDERAELDALRAAKNAPVVTESAVTLPPTHWLWRADGEVIESNGVMTHHEGIQIVAAYEKPAELVNEPATPHVF